MIAFSTDQTNLVAAHKLILFPKDPACPPVDTTVLAAKLRAIGLLGAPRQVQGHTFYPVGEHFLQLVTFLGCSPSIELEPPSDPVVLADHSAGGKFCHVLLNCTDTLQFRSGPGTRVPRCPACQTPLADWQARIQEWRSNPARDKWQCTGCGAEGTLTGLHFGKTAGFGRSFVEIRGIYRSEAVAGETLLNTLKSLTNGDWSTIYINE